MFHVPVEKHGRNAELRQKGKIAVLALGYGGSVGALDAMGGKRLGLSEQEEADTVRKWRSANPNIVRFWAEVERAATTCCTTGETISLGALEFAMHEKTMTIKLPSGRQISYPNIELCTSSKFGTEALRYKGLSQQTNKWCWIETFGGKLTENIIQATARDCLAVAMTKVAAAGISIVFHVHDELICETEKDKLDTIQKIFSEPVSWAPGLPLSGAGYTTPYYLKD